MTRLAIFGDSIAWGSWDPEGGGWTARLKRHYMQLPPSKTKLDDYVGVHVCATSGHKVADVEARMASDLVAVVPDWSLIAIGTNGVAHNGQPGTDRVDFEQSPTDCIQTAKATNESSATF